MLKLESILTAINAKLIEKFNIDINENDISKGFDRPSFFVEFDNVYKNNYLFTFERSLTIRIYYFPSNKHKYQREVLEIQQEIEDLFHLGITVEDRHISIVGEIESDVIDGVLQVSFDLKYLDSSYKEPDKEKMGGLNLNA